MCSTRHKRRGVAVVRCACARARSLHTLQNRGRETMNILQDRQLACMHFRGSDPCGSASNWNYMYDSSVFPRPLVYNLARTQPGIVRARLPPPAPRIGKHMHVRVGRGVLTRDCSQDVVVDVVATLCDFSTRPQIVVLDRCAAVSNHTLHNQMHVDIEP